MVEAGKIKWALFDLAVYHCVYFKHPKMFSKVSVFETGKMISIGTKTLEQADHDLKHVAKILIKAKHIHPIKIETVLRNIVATVELENKLDLENIARKLSPTIYEPEQFPGVIWRPKDLNASILVFASGKLVVAGLKSMSDYRRLPNYLTEKLSPFLGQAKSLSHQTQKREKQP